MSDPKADEARRRRRTEQIQRRLDEALEPGFPASDPVSIVTSQHEEDGTWTRLGHRPAPAPDHLRSKVR